MLKASKGWWYSSGLVVSVEMRFDLCVDAENRLPESTQRLKECVSGAQRCVDFHAKAQRQHPTSSDLKRE